MQISKKELCQKFFVQDFDHKFKLEQILQNTNNWHAFFGYIYSRKKPAKSKGTLTQIWKYPYMFVFI